MSLHVTDLELTMGDRTILNKINLEVPTGAMVGLLGPNGSGKSSLLKVLYGVHQPRAGTVRIDDDDLLALSPRDAAQRLAVVAQESAIEFDFTVDEVVLTGRTPHRTGLFHDDTEDRSLCADALEAVGCTHLAKRPFAEMSGGEKQRVLIARALAQGTSHLLLDEPTNHLDLYHQVEILELVASLDRTVLTALHDLSLAAMFCDFVYVIADGEIVTHGPPDDVIDADLVRDVFGANVLITPHPDLGVPYLIPRSSGLTQRKPREQ